MQSVYNFVVKPIGERYNNIKKIGDKDLILNTEIFNHQFINRHAEVVSVPMVGDNLNISIGDKVIIHHNVFRRWHDIKGKERNSGSYFDDNTYIISSDQIYLFDKGDGWEAPKGWTFVKPVVDSSDYALEKELDKVGIVEYSDKFNKGELVGLSSGYKHEFIIDGHKLYRAYTKYITIKYGDKRNEETYNPSWAQSG
jgi:hypothetical protein